VNVAALDKRQSRRTLAVCSVAHAVHDGFTDLLNVLYPMLQAQFGLSYTAIGAIKAAYSSAMAMGQIPSGRLADRWGSALLLALGTAIAALGYIAAGLAGTLASVSFGLILAGLGGATQHPIASSLVASAYAGRNSRSALGTYNFAGDLGKVAVPAAFALLATLVGWQYALLCVGFAGVLTAGFIIALLTQSTQQASGVAAKGHLGRDQPWAFRILLFIHVADNLVRTGVMVFLPFLLRDRGADLPTIGLGLSLLFAGGAAGKLVFGWAGQRVGVVPTVVFTELVTAAMIVALAVSPLPVAACLALLPLLGLTVNGTSSVLYGTVPEFVAPEKRTYAFAVFYTGGSIAGAVSPVAFGVVADIAGLTSSLVIVALICLATTPLVFSLRKAF